MKDKNISKLTNAPYTEIDFNELEKKTNILADLIEARKDKLVDILLIYESYEVASDEIDRTLDLLRHIRENKKYFKLRIGPVTSFLPRNQPMYALSCFVLIPSLMASEVHFRIPHTIKHFFEDVLQLLNIRQLFPNIYVSEKERLEFLKERSAVFENEHTQETRPVTEAVIFTGTQLHAEKLRVVFDKRTLFISNGAGHNPVVVSDDANLDKAVEAVIMLQFYNQGQDCAAPNAVLVHQKVFQKFLKKLQDEVKATKVGDYRDRISRVGPISDPVDLIRIQRFLIEHLQWIDPSTPGIISAKTSTVTPTIISKPLKEGGNFIEMFAPIIFVQEYSSDQALKDYFEDKQYARNAMYVTVYGTSSYVDDLKGRYIDGKLLHDGSTIIHNNHLHAPGVERGTNPYGGYGYGASSTSYNGKLVAMPTLPQRDIYETLVKPLSKKESLKKANSTNSTQILHKNIRKLLQIKLPEQESYLEPSLYSEGIYLDVEQFKDSAARYVKISEDRLYPLLKKPNTKYAAMLEIKQTRLLQDLLALIELKPTITFKDFETRLYAIPKDDKASNKQNKLLQRRFFESIYQMLFGRNEGPRLAEFLWSVEENKISSLIEVADVHSHRAVGNKH